MTDNDDIDVTEEDWEFSQKLKNPVFVNLYAPELMHARAYRKYLESKKQENKPNNEDD